MVYVCTKDLQIIPCSLKIAYGILKDRKYVGERLQVSIPSNWPLKDLREYLPTYFEKLLWEPSLFGWGIWLVIHSKDQKIIGDIGFMGPPDYMGIIEIGYSIIPEYRNRGYAFEGTKALIKWAFDHREVEGIIAHCRQDNIASAKVLKKLGMKEVARLDHIIKWQLTRERFLLLHLDK